MIRKKERCLTSHKGGNIIFDAILFIIVIFVFALISIYGYKIFTDMDSDILNDLTLNESKDAFNEVEGRYPSVLDGLFIFILIGMWVAGIVAALMADEHPLLFGFMMLLIVFVVIAGAMFSNFYSEFFADAEFGTVASSFPMTNWALNNLVLLTIAVAASIALALLGKNKL